MDMASDIIDEMTGERYTVMNPQFRQFEGNKIERVMSKLISKFLSDSSFRIIKWFMTNNKTHFQETASFLYAKWSSDKVYNKARVISYFWAEPDFINAQDYNKDVDTLLYSVSGGKQENIDHLEQWIAYKYLFPERVANTPNLDICGPLGANGKGRYLELCKTVFTYGCVTPATAKELSDGFNASWEMSTIIYFDEPTEKELPTNKVKNATGGEEQRIEKKGVDAYTADRNYNIMALSNNEEGVFRLAGNGMAGQDRRYSVVSTDIILIDEIIKRENCTFEEATVRVNQIAQLVKDRKEVRKWLAHVIMKHNVMDMKILHPLHGEDYHKRFEDQKDTVQQVFDALLPTILYCGVMTIDVLQQAVQELGNMKTIMTPQKIKQRFQKYLDQHKIKYEYVKNTRISLLHKGEVSETLQKHHYRLTSSNTNYGLEYSMFSSVIPNKGTKLTQQDFTIQI
jgi:phage/plasmid-associated DNA primase